MEKCPILCFNKSDDVYQIAETGCLQKDPYREAAEDFWIFRL